MQENLITSDRFALRPLRQEDVTDQYVQWLNEEETSRFISEAQLRHHDIESVRTYLEARIGRKDVLFLGVFVRHTGVHIGNIKFEPIDRTSKTTEMGILIGEKQWRGRGVASEILAAASKYLNDALGIQEITLGVSCDNHPAMRAYRKANFVVYRRDAKRNALRMKLRYTSSHSYCGRIALGTVQFGFPYGIANKGKAVSRKEVANIVKLARAAGMQTLDTATGYGASEEVLGDVGVAEWDVVTKIEGVPENCPDIKGWIRSAFEGSLKRLKVNHVKGLLLHKPMQLLEPGGDTIFQTLTELKEEHLVEKIGFSIYSPDQLASLWKDYRPDLVQGPFSVVDRRISQTGWLQKMHRCGVEFHARSVFLQGVLLMDDATRPAQFNPWQDLWTDWRDWVLKHQVTPYQAALTFVMSQPEIDRVIIGVDSAEQLKANILSERGGIPMPPENLAVYDENLINPSCWGGGSNATLVSYGLMEQSI